MEDDIQDPSPPAHTIMPTIQDLRNSPDLWYKLNVLIYDLRNFKLSTSQQRLELIVDPSYIGAPYFTPSQAAQLKATMVNETQTLAELIQATLDEKLERRMKKRVESGDFRVCAAHDLAPVFERALGIGFKSLGKDKKFRRLVEKKGLELTDEVWGEDGKGKAGKKGKK